MINGTELLYYRHNIFYVPTKILKTSKHWTMDKSDTGLNLIIRTIILIVNIIIFSYACII